MVVCVMLVGDTLLSVVEAMALVVELLLLLMKQAPLVAQFPASPVQASVTGVVVPVTNVAGEGVVTVNVPIAGAVLSTVNCGDVIGALTLPTVSVAVIVAVRLGQVV